MKAHGANAIPPPMFSSLLPAPASSSSTENYAGRHVLLRSSWQTVNIGDIGHSPGVIALLERHLPGVRITLWPDQLDRGVRQMLLRRFPALEIADGTIGIDGLPTTPALATAFRKVDMLVHGSGPYVVALPHIEAWSHLTGGKPYGIYGVTIDPLGPIMSGADLPDEGDTLANQRKQIEGLPHDHLPARLRRVLEKAAFVFCRDTLSLDYLRAQSLSGPVLDFGPDGAFGIDLFDDSRAGQFLQRNGLTSDGFICVIPRLRFTPYHLTHDVPATARDLARAAISERHREHDLGLLREMIVRWVRETGLKVLVCPEMTYQVEVGRELCGDHLPPDVRNNVVWRPDYWLPDEACSTYARALAVVSMDNHSPIFALAVGTPTLFIRQPTDTTKGQMWPDVGLGDWFFEVHNATGDALAQRLFAIHQDPSAARARVAAIMRFVCDRQRQTFAPFSDLLTPSQNH